MQNKLLWPGLFVPALATMEVGNRKFLYWMTNETYITSMLENLNFRLEMSVLVCTLNFANFLLKNISTVSYVIPEIRHVQFGILISKVSFFYAKKRSQGKYLSFCKKIRF